jgi:hypothetical protein
LIKNFDHHLQYAERDTKQISLPGQEAFFLSTAFSAVGIEGYKFGTKNCESKQNDAKSDMPVASYDQTMIKPVQIP